MSSGSIPGIQSPYRKFVALSCQFDIWTQYQILFGHHPFSKVAPQLLEDDSLRFFWSLGVVYFDEFRCFHMTSLTRFAHTYRSRHLRSNEMVIAGLGPVPS